ncbi:MAG: amidase family protein [Thermomicrobiales bacterium]
MSIDPFSSAAGMLRALSEREISSVELTRFHIDRIERLDGPINAVVVRDFDRALDSAREADAGRTGHCDPSLLGLPMTVKDAFFVEGLPATGGGIPERAGIVASWDAPFVTAIKRGGGIIVGKRTCRAVYAADHQSANPRIAGGHRTLGI